MIDYTLNTPEMINNIYVADITRCFKFIIIFGNDILYNAIEFNTNLGMTNMRHKTLNLSNYFGLELMTKELQLNLYGHLHVLNMVNGSPY